MDSSGFQNNMSNRARVCTSVPGQNMDVGQTTPDASVVVHGELMDYTQPPTFPGDTSILDSDGASCFFNQADLAHGQLSSANGSMNLAEQSRPPVQCTSPNRSLDILVQQAQRPTAQPCIETMLTPGSADQVLCQQGQLPFAASADPASGSNSQNLFGFCHGEKQGHPGLLQQRHFSQLDHQMVSFTESYHSEHPKYAMPNSQEMAEQGFTYCGDGTYKCDACNIKLSTKQSPIASDILKNHRQLCRREMHFHSPQEQMLPRRSERAAMVFAEDEYGHRHVLHGPVKRPEYAAYDKRVESFHMKSFSAPKTPRELASAGLYFLCEPDHVVCFSCGVRFHNWEPDDDPWGEHARLSPDCTFVKQVLHHSVQQQPIKRSAAAIQARTPLAATGILASFQPGTLDTSAHVQGLTYVSTISLDGIPSMSSQIDCQAIADMGYQPDQIRRALTKLKSKKHIGVIDTNRIVNEILEMDETKVTPRCFQCHQDMRDGYTLLPCGHVAICLNCSVDNILVCPVCNRRVTRCVVTYPDIKH